MGTLNHLCIGLALVSQGFAQSATRFQTPAVPPAAVPQAAAPVQESFAATPSRLVAPAAMESYLESMVSVFSAMSREKDPFGQVQDPDVKPAVVATTPGLARRTVTQATPLSEIVSHLPITTIMPGEKSFLIGTRKVAVGQEVPLVWRGKTLRVVVTQVSSSRLSFRDAETGETGDRIMTLLPPGMSAGGGLKQILAPGMVPDRANAPIDLGGGDMSMNP